MPEGKYFYWCKIIRIGSTPKAVFVLSIWEKRENWSLIPTITNKIPEMLVSGAALLSHLMPGFMAQMFPFSFGLAIEQKGEIP